MGTCIQRAHIPSEKQARQAPAITQKQSTSTGFMICLTMYLFLSLFLIGYACPKIIKKYMWTKITVPHYFYCNIQIPVLGYHVITVKGFACANDPRSSYLGLYACTLDEGTDNDCCLCLRPRHQFIVSTFFASLEGVLESAPPGYSLIFLGDFNAHVGSDSEIWRGVVGKNEYPQSEPEQCSVAGLLCLSWIVYNENHFQAWRCLYVHLAPGHLKPQFHDQLS